jgi:Ca2+-binding RTX toxin-like protein
MYLSNDATITTSDTLLAPVSSAQLAAGAVDTKNLSVTLPANLAAGTYYIGGIADYNNQVAETTEGYNKGNTVAITVGGGGTTAKPDLTESVSVVGSTTVAAGAGMTISSTVSNLGSGASPASTAGIYLSTDATITTSDTLLSTVASPQLAAGSVDTKNLSVTLPANLAAGTYYIGGIADYNNQVNETTGYNNNANAVAIEVNSGGGGVENLTGTNFNDLLIGTNGDNVLIGLDGNDTLIGLGGNDTLTGGRGAGSADTFVFNPGFGHDTITDFSAWRDVMQFSPALFANYAAVMESTQVGADTVITFDANNTVTLANVSAPLSSTNFRFA